MHFLHPDLLFSFHLLYPCFYPHVWPAFMVWHLEPVTRHSHSKGVGSISAPMSLAVCKMREGMSGFPLIPSMKADSNKWSLCAVFQFSCCCVCRLWRAWKRNGWGLLHPIAVCALTLIGLVFFGLITTCISWSSMLLYIVSVVIFLLSLLTHKFCYAGAHGLSTTHYDSSWW